MTDMQHILDQSVAIPHDLAAARRHTAKQPDAELLNRMLGIEVAK